MNTIKFLHSKQRHWKQNYRNSNTQKENLCTIQQISFITEKILICHTVILVPLKKIWEIQPTSCVHYCMLYLHSLCIIFSE